MDMILFEVLLRNIHLIPHDQIVQWHSIYNINSAVVISVVVESGRCSSEVLQEGSCPYAPLDEALRCMYMHKIKQQKILIEKCISLNLVLKIWHYKIIKDMQKECIYRSYQWTHFCNLSVYVNVCVCVCVCARAVLFRPLRFNHKFTE